MLPVRNVCDRLKGISSAWRCQPRTETFCVTSSLPTVLTLQSKSGWPTEARLWPSVATALRYFDLNLGWRPLSIGGRLTARRVPDEPFEPVFTDFKPF